MPVRRPALAVGLAVLVFTGCSSGKRLYSVEGTVVFEDGSPAVELAGGLVSLESVEDMKNAAGEIQKDATFRVRTPLGQDGAPAGTYRVAVRAGEGRRNSPIDTKYGRYATSGIELTIKEEPNKVEVKVQRLKGR
jgi:hypothetical protein